jgi:transglutaminase-like putative cysteine protease
MPNPHSVFFGIVLLGAYSLFLAGCDVVGTAANFPVEDSFAEERVFEFEYRVEVPPSAGESEPTQLFVPIAGDSEVQRIISLEVRSPIEGSIETEEGYGNRYWHAVLPAERKEALSIAFLYTVKRRINRTGDARVADAPVDRFLTANARVVVAHPILDPILAEIRSAAPDAGPEERARGIYDWVVDNVEYKKVGTGWGNGDTFWACNERYGNCTDFHSLFISLARTEGIPARFEMGFPVPTDRGAGKISGYHCWVEFWLPEVGWVPIDASEAFRHPEKRDLFYGTHPADRIHFTTGRDLRLGPAHGDLPLNYFVYPYTEVGGTASNLEITTEFLYRDVEEPTGVVAG